MGQDIQQASSLKIEDILKQLAKMKANGCLQLSHNSIIYFIYFNEGKLIYATNSLAPFERLERHLRRLSNRNSKLSNDLIKEARQKFRNILESYTDNPSDYQGLLWLASKQPLIITQEEAVTVLRRITREVFESILSLRAPLQYSFVEQTSQLTELCSFDLDSYLKQCQKRLQAWQVFASHIYSSYQRLYLANFASKSITNLTAEQNETICQLLKGLNFRQISALINKDELVVARILYPAIINDVVLARSPKPPFDKLPSLPNSKYLFEDITAEAVFKNLEPDAEINNQAINSDSKETIYSIEKKWKVAYVDDNQDVYQQLQELLEPQMFTISFIKEPMNAFAQLIEFKPEIILLNAEMPNINGYELCGLLKSHQNFKYVPIIILSEEQGLLNLTKAKFAGAADHLSKPFTQSSLFNVIFKYLH
ncbi:MAG TPA: response regulator [Xenococcaceae cyanobacterium]